MDCVVSLLWLLDRRESLDVTGTNSLFAVLRRTTRHLQCPSKVWPVGRLGEQATHGIQIYGRGQKVESHEA
jgi:hypothetical protein